MIGVKVKFLSNSKDQHNAIEAAMVNAVANGYAEEVRKELEDIKCENHPNQRSVLTVIADKRKQFKLEKTSFCCSEFADLVDQKIKH